jgi:hypothetical protein
VDPGTSSRHQQLTSGQDTRSARCVERRTPGAGGDLRETDWWQHQHRARGSTSPRPDDQHRRVTVRDLPGRYGSDGLGQTYSVWVDVGNAADGASETEGAEPV